MQGTEFEPTADQRALVESAAAFGLTQADIAEQLKIDEKTLRKRFRDELSSGKFEVDMTAGKTLMSARQSSTHMQVRRCCNRGGGGGCPKWDRKRSKWDG